VSGLTTDKNSTKNNIQQELIAIIQPDEFELDWQQSDENLSKEQIFFQKKLYTKYREGIAEFLFFLGFTGELSPVSQSIHFLYTITTSFVKNLARTPDIEILREKIIVKPETEEIDSIIHNAPYMNGIEHINQNWIKNVWVKLNKLFSAKIKDYSGSVAEFFTAQNPDIHPAGRIFFHLVENKKGDQPFAFLATYSSDTVKNGKTKHLPLKNALVEYKKDNKKLLKLLSTVHKASEKSSFISELVDTGDIFHPIRLTDKEAYTFLKEIPLYEDSGILCRIPDWWKSKSNSFRLSINIGDKPPSHLGYDALVDFNTQLSLGDEEITVEELEKLLSESEGLAFIKGKWVEVNHQKLKETLNAYKKAQEYMNRKDVDMIEAMRFQLNASKKLDISEETCELEISNGEWLNTVISKLIHPDKIESIPPGDNFQATLRNYQQKGVSWLYFMKKLGLGACLADDMGLGKTIQVIALLNYIRANKNEKTLLAVPTSLISNWLNEIKKFTPSLKYFVLHPSENKDIPENKSELLKEHDIFITSYGMLYRYDWITDISWDSFILDEAQAIKNPATKQTQAAKKINADFKITMTGTPLENRLSDLWSLFDFLNKGLLGTASEFTDFTRQLKESNEGYAHLKQTVSPFILRRLKTDKDIISDLPEKIEMKTYSRLSKKQAALYSKLTDELKRKIESSEPGIKKKGLVLSSIMKFKQICNHPAQYLGQDVYTEAESGKFTRLREICETIYKKRERVLIFTQFKEIIEPLKEFLEDVFEHRGLVLHGSTPVKRRKEVVNKFQNHQYIPFLILSLKAGGVGLNLTAANHVVHFDRWWNPAVENQATDRAFRIGQKKNVVVHKFVTKGTIEEKIDLMIEEKTKLSKEIIPEMQENWITEMDNEQLMELFTLSI
jgi:non-specific serine/threonine protein kinase